MTTGIYLHAYPQAKTLGEVFYVGKGTPHRSRVWNDSRNPYYRNIVRKIGTVGKFGKKDVTVVYLECPSEPIAFALEEVIIKYLRDNGIKLANLTDGGEGCNSGDEHWTKRQPERVKRGAEHKNFGKVRSLETREKVSQSLMGRNVWNKGIKEDKKWMTDGINSKCLYAKDQAEFLANGWKFGKTVSQATRTKISLKVSSAWKKKAA